MGTSVSISAQASTGPTEAGGSEGSRGCRPGARGEGALVGAWGGRVGMRGERSWRGWKNSSWEEEEAARARGPASGVLTAPRSMPSRMRLEDW